MRKTFIPLLLVALPLAAQTVYTYKDKEGNPVFTEQPPSNVNAQPVRLPPTTQNVETATFNAAAATTETSNPQPKKQPIINGVTILGLPKDDGSLRANNGSFSVTVQIQSDSAALPSYAYQIFFDGQPYGAHQADNTFAFNNIDRGTHTMQAKVFNNGILLAASGVETFTIQKVSTKQWKIQPR